VADTSAPQQSRRSYRARQLLAASEHASRVAEELGQLDLGDVDAESPDTVGLVRFNWEAPADAGDVVDRVREASRRRWDGWIPSISPNHIFAPEVDPDTGTVPDLDFLQAASDEMGGPASPPMVTRAFLKDRTAANSVSGRGVTVGVLDTGVRPHPWFEGSFLATPGDDLPGDFDPLDENDDHELDRQAGHGTFVTGLILQQAPGATIRIIRVLDRDGKADVQTVANGIAALGAQGVDIINLSLGGYTRHDNEPMAIRNALQGLPRGTVVVSAAGNHGATSAGAAKRPFYPAASRGVVGVAALAPTENGKLKRASFSNLGPWIDCSTVGFRVLSTFVNFHDIRGKTFRGWAKWSGTSFAAPAVSGAIAARMTDADGNRVATAFQAKRALLGGDATVGPERLQGDAENLGVCLDLHSPFVA